MLRSLKDIEHFEVNASDGDIGSVVRFLFDDERWIVRYLVVQAGGPLLLDGRLVLISPISFEQVDWSTKRFHLALTMDKVKNSPGIDLAKPISREHERDYFGYYGYSYYWGYPGLWGMGGYPMMLASRGDTRDVPAEDSDASSKDLHLRSDQEVSGYHVHGMTKRSAISRTSLWTMRPGKSDIWSWTPVIGGSARKFSLRHSGQVASVGGNARST